MNNEIKKYCEHCKFYSVLGCRSTLICKEGNRFSAADVQPVKRGRWVHDESGYDRRDNWYHCSECNRTLNLICGEKLEDYPYCHCGARMVKDGEQND